MDRKIFVGKGKWDNGRDDYPSYEKRYGRKGNRKTKTKTHANEIPFECSVDRWEKIAGDDWFRGRVVEVHKRYAFVSTETPEGDLDTSDVWLCTVARKHLTSQRAERNFICVGDLVLCRPAYENEVSGSSELPQGAILHLAPRSSSIARLDPHRGDRKHVLAANMDQLVIVASFLKPTVKWGLIDRYLVLAELEDLPATIVLNKEDLLAEGSEEFRKQAKARISHYREMGYQVTIIQANDPTPEQLEQVRSVLKGKITLLSGHSGVGKSSVVNLFDPEIVQDVEPDEDIFYKGRHTTTYSSLILLKSVGIVIDTPGIRSFCIEETNSVDLSYCFRDLRKYLSLCRYRGCTHLEEPECVVKEALESGEIKPWRYESYKAILLGASGREGRMRSISLEDTLEE